MRVLHLDTGTTMRGGQWQVLALLQALGESNGIHTLLSPAGGPLMQAAKERKLNVASFNLLALRASAREHDLIHAHDARSHTWAAALTECRLVVSRRVAFPVGKFWLSRWKYGKPGRYLAVSNHVKASLVAAGVPEDRICVVYDGVELPQSLSSGNQVLALDTHDPMKGRDLIQQAAKIAGLPLCYSKDLSTDLPTAALFVYITRSEGLGSAALLAMAAGVPVVASRVGGLPEIVEDGVNGVLTENEPAAIASAIQRALDLRQQLAQNARRCVEERFSQAQMMRGTLEVYQRVLA